MPVSDQLSRKRWGSETAAGERVLAAIAAERAQGGAVHSTAASAAKKRKTRWAPQTAITTVAVPGIPGVELPATVATLAAAIDDSSTALQHELIRVRLHSFWFGALHAMACMTPALHDVKSPCQRF
jgi:hypothetical protein